MLKAKKEAIDTFCGRLGIIMAKMFCLLFIGAIANTMCSSVFDAMLIMGVLSIIADVFLVGWDIGDVFRLKKHSKLDYVTKSKLLADFLGINMSLQLLIWQAILAHINGSITVFGHLLSSTDIAYIEMFVPFFIVCGLCFRLEAFQDDDNDLFITAKM